MPDQINSMAMLWPYMSLWLRYSGIYWDNFADYWLLWVWMSFYLGTTIFAAVVAYRLRFDKYDLQLVRNTTSAIYGCIFGWMLCFPFFLYNCGLILFGKAQVRNEDTPRNKGRCLSRLAVWSISGFWIGCMAFPSSVQSPVRYYEGMAVVALKDYANAQVRYKQLSIWDDGGGSKYCDHFPNLYYGKDAQGQQLMLIPKSLADATVNEGQERLTRRGKPVAPYGYVFLEDPYIVKHNLWDEQFGLVAYPERPGRTGFTMYCIGTDGQVYFQECIGDTASLITEEESPLHKDGVKLWTLM